MDSLHFLLCSEKFFVNPKNGGDTKISEITFSLVLFRRYSPLARLNDSFESMVHDYFYSYLFKSNVEFTTKTKYRSILT